MKNKKIIKILAYDPGSVTGWALLKYNIDKNEIAINHYGVISIKTLIPNLKELKRKFKLNHVIGEIIYQSTCSQIDKFKPDYIFVEDAFFNRLRPTAFGPLIHLIANIVKASIDLRKLPIYTLEAKKVKKIILKGNASKEEIRDEVLKMIDIKLKPDTALSLHISDAIAGGIAFIKKILPSL